ncbi:MAG: topoisomerase DNA-binding C4 zinc finger domain-containing protein [Oribacterium sp.]|nr:topoisomerase DNA-binding C4 zinc finger domain-containing protein [Oribacterium sp.]
MLHNHVPVTVNLVVKWGELNNTIRENSAIASVSHEQMKTIVEMFNMANIDSKETRKEHVSNIHEKTMSEHRSIQQGICPECGGSLVKRNGKYGVFYGCSNYPNCKYTKNV